MSSSNGLSGRGDETILGSHLLVELYLFDIAPISTDLEKEKQHDNDNILAKVRCC